MSSLFVQQIRAEMAGASARLAQDELRRTRTVQPPHDWPQDGSALLRALALVVAERRRDGGLEVIAEEI